MQIADLNVNRHWNIKLLAINKQQYEVALLTILKRTFEWNVD